MLLSADRAKVLDVPLASSPVKLSVNGEDAGQNEPPVVGELPVRAIVPLKSLPLFMTVRKPVSTDVFAPPMQTCPVFPVDSHTSV